MTVPAQIDLGNTDIDALKRVTLHKDLQRLPGLQARLIAIPFACHIDGRGHGRIPRGSLREDSLSDTE